MREKGAGDGEGLEDVLRGWENGLKRAVHGTFVKNRVITLI